MLSIPLVRSSVPFEKREEGNKENGKEGATAKVGATTTRTQLSVKKKNVRVPSKGPKGMGEKKLVPGDICSLKITALAANNIGIDEYSFPYAVFVPNAKIGSQIKAKILKIKESSYAIAQLLEEKNADSVRSSVTSLHSADAPIKPGDVLTVSIQKQIENGKAGIVEFPNNFRLIIPFSGSNLKGNGSLPLGKETNALDNVKVTVTRVKSNYGFAKIETSGSVLKAGVNSLKVQEKGKETRINPFSSNFSLEVGSKFTTTLRSSVKSFTKGNGKFLVLNLTSRGFFQTAVFPSFSLETEQNGTLLSQQQRKEGEQEGKTVLFLKMKKGGAYYQKLVMNGKLRVRIKITSKSANCLVGKILQVNPVSKTKKTSLVLNSIREMISHGMHFGEKAVKCNARMKNYIWSTPSSSVASPSAFSSVGQTFFNSEWQGGTNKQAASLLFSSGTNGKKQTPLSHIKGVASHSFGTNKNNAFSLPKGRDAQPQRGTEKNGQHREEQLTKRPLIKKGRHVINLLKTRRCLNQALKKVTKYALKGRTFLFIGTKKPAAGLVARASFFTKNSFYVNTRWLGGMLTNWKTICKSISKIRPILKEKQKVVRHILERRQAIKNRLIKKALLLRKKSKLILSKGRLLLETLKKQNSSFSPSLREGKERPMQEEKNSAYNSKKLILLRDEFINKGMQYVERRQKLIQKRKELIYQTALLKEKGLELCFKHKSVLNQLAIYAKKLREYKYLLILTSEIKNMKAVTSMDAQKETASLVNLLSVSYGKLKEMNLPLTGSEGKTVKGTNKAVGFSNLVPSPLVDQKEDDKNSQQNLDWIMPNPPKEFLNRIIVCAAGGTKAAGRNVTPSLISDKSSVASNEVGRAGQFIVCSTLLSKFSGFSSYIKSVIKLLTMSILSLETQAKLYSSQLNQIQTTLQTYLNLKQKYVNELQQLKLKFKKERHMIRIIKRKLKALEAQKKLLKFLPRLRYLPTPQTKISEIVQILLARIVDPKLKYPIENIYNQKLSNSSKKLAAARKKKWQRLEKYFGGIANMTKLTKTQIGRNIAIIIGQKEEMNAVRECQKLGIKMFTIVDTNCNPTFSDHIIPANDDSRSSIKFILTKFITRIRLAQKLRSRLSVYMAK